MMRSLLLILVACGAFAAPLPYRFLLVVGNQWEDDASYLIERSGEFQIVAALLKTWDLPFDVLRLDQQRMDRYHLLDREGRPLYGTILWDAPAEQLKDKNIAILKELNQQGVALIALGDTVAAPEVAQLAGLRYVSEYKSQEGPAFDFMCHVPFTFQAGKQCTDSVLLERSRRRRQSVLALGGRAARVPPHVIHHELLEFA